MKTLPTALRIFITVLACMLTISIAQAYSCAYVVKGPTYINSDFIAVLNERNFTVTVIDDSAVAGTNFSLYDLLLVGDGNLLNPANIPVNRMPTVIANTYHTDTWGWADEVGSIVSNQPLQGQNQVLNSITQVCLLLLIS